MPVSKFGSLGSRLFLVSVACTACLLTVGTAFGANYWRLDAESTTSATTKILGFKGNTSLVTEDFHGGAKSMRIDVVGDDGGNQAAGVDVVEVKLGASIHDGGWFHYRWWMKLDAGFSWGEGTAKTKASRIKSTCECEHGPWTGYVRKHSVYIGECPACQKEGHPPGCDPSEARIAYDFQAAAPIAVEAAQITSPQAGECDAPDPAWLWCDDFERDRLAQYFEVNDNGGEFARQAGAGVEGSTAMRVKWQAGEDEAGNLKVAVGRTPVGTSKSLRGAEDFRELYVRLYLRMQAGWQGNPYKLTRTMVFASPDRSQAMIGHLWQGSGNKMSLDPVSCVDGNGQVACGGYNDFDNMQWLGIGEGQTEIFSASNADKWFCIEHHVKLNDAGRADGVQEFWIDGRLEARRDGLDFVGSYAEYGLNAVFFENYWNGGAPRGQERYFDNIVVSTRPVGCAES